VAKVIPMMATVAEIRALVERAFDVIDAYVSEDQGEPDPEGPLDDDRPQRAQAAFLAARDGLRYAASAAGQLGDPALLPLLSDVHEALEHWDDHADYYRHVVLAGVTEILRRGAAVDETVEKLAQHHAPSVRAAIAAGLRPHGGRAVAVLSALATDSSADVRTPAKAALAETGEVPWWLGKFASDPLVRLTPEEAAQHKEAIEEISKLLDVEPYRIHRHDEDFARLVTALPAPIAVEAAERALTAGGNRAGRLPLLGAATISRPGGIDAFLRVCQAWGKNRHFFVGDDHVRMIAGAPDDVRLAACLALARHAVSAPESVRTQQSGPVHIAAEIAGKAFPPGADLTPLLDLVLGCPAVPDRKIDWAIGGLNDALMREGADPTPIAGRLVEALLHGFPGPWKKLSTAVTHLVEGLPREALRAAAEEAARSDDDGTARWGLSSMLLAAHDPERDPEPLAMLRRLCEEPRFRKLLFEDYRARAATVPLQREELRRGAFAFQEAASALGLIDGLWGRLITGLGALLAHPPEQVEKERAELRERFAAFLGPEALHGPITDEEWAIFRRARDGAAELAPRDWMTGLRILPPGPWHPADRAFVERAVEACEKEIPTLVYFAAATLSEKPDAELLPLFYRMLRAAPDQRDTLRDYFVAARNALGIKPGAIVDAGGAPLPREWMDEPDEPDDDDDGEEDDE